MKDHTLGSAPIEPALHEKMTALAHGVDQILNGNAPAAKTVGFVLLAFNFGERGRCNYISNADRADVVALLTEQLAYFKGMPDEPRGGNHENRH